MKVTLSILCIILLFGIQVRAQSDSTWKKWDWLMGEWKGEGNGKPGEGSGKFSFKPDLNNNILVRKAHTVYPASDGKPETVHDDLLIVYLDFSGNPFKAIYFDNEGHTINYGIKYYDKKIVFTSEWATGMPIYRLSYEQVEEKKVNTKFEMSNDNKNFTTYVEGISKKVK